MEPGIVEKDQEAYHTELAMEVLSQLIPEALDQASADVRSRFDNALLNMAVNRIVNVEGPVFTATILWRLADALQSGQTPSAEQPIDLTRLDDGGVLITVIGYSFHAVLDSRRFNDSALHLSRTFVMSHPSVLVGRVTDLFLINPSKLAYGN